MMVGWQLAVVVSELVAVAAVAAVAAVVAVAETLVPWVSLLDQDQDLIKQWK